MADDRTTVRFRYLCSNDLGRRDVTLFASGTVRLREGLWDSQEMYLGELAPEELASALDKLAEIRSEIEDPTVKIGRVDREWVEECEIELALPDSIAWSHRFSPVGMPPLIVSRLVAVAEDLAEHTRPPTPRRPAGRRLPAAARRRAPYPGGGALGGAAIHHRPARH